MASVVRIFTDCQIYDSSTRSFVQGSLAAEDDRILSVIPEGGALPEGEVISLDGGYMIPGLVDVHTHGRGGYDFNSAPSDSYGRIALSYARAGTTSLMPTLASAPFDLLERSTKDIAAYGNDPGSAAFVGVHIEGRYLSHSKRGAHPAHLLSLPSSEELRRLRILAGDSRMRLSIAPELKGADLMIAAAVELGITVSAAHTDADYSTLAAAVAMGVSGFTHTFNAMRPLHHRDPGGAGAALLIDSAYAEFICDGMHISPEMILLSERVKDAEHFVLITDSMEAAGCADGEYSIAGLPVTVKDGRAVNSEGALAGSTLDMFTGLCNFMEYTGMSLEDAIPRATEIPAKMVGAEDFVGSLTPGLRCDFIIIKDKKSPVISRIFAGATEVIR